MIFSPAEAFTNRIGAHMAKARNQAVYIEQERHLRQMEGLEELLEFDLPSLVQYADGVAEKRQQLTRRLQRAVDDV
jgi:hypothetical protein